VDEVVGRVTPEPPEGELEALVAAVSAALVEERRALDAWSAAALAEATEKALDE
jgi:hypothetical protein